MYNNNAYSKFHCRAYSVTSHNMSFWVQTPKRLMMFLCLPILFIWSISVNRSSISFSLLDAVYNACFNFFHDVKNMFARISFRDSLNT